MVSAPGYFETTGCAYQVKQKFNYGDGDSSYVAAGGTEGIRQLVDDFYDVMGSIPEAADILAMHPQDLELSRDKLTCFLCGWLGGPRLYHDRYGDISIPAAHLHLKIGPVERDAWLLCMKQAIEKQDYHPHFKRYLYEQLCIPAFRVTNQ